LALRHAEYAKLAYDRVAGDYDDLFSGHMTAINSRLDRDLRIRPGHRVADLACGTGVGTVGMARAAAPGEVIGVDYSEGMLSAARERVRDAGLDVTFVHARAEEFIAHAPSGTFDVVSMRFVLAYLDWRSVLAGMSRLLAPGGRVGVMTSLSGSIPQFSELYHKFRKSPEPAWKLFQHTRRNLGETWRIYRQLRDTFGEPSFITVPDSTDQVAQRLAAGGLSPLENWTETVRIWFDSGRDAVEWMHASGYVTHSSLQHVPPVVLEFLGSLFAAGMETFRERRGVPLDLVVAAVVAERPRA
jgi:ubiquinone/menaquinone biosynthesis C-methylase UbiE